MLLEWLHQGCDIDLSADFLNFGVGVSNFPSKNIKKIFQNYFFLFWCRDPSVKLQFPKPLRVILLHFAIQPVQIAL